MDIDCTQSFYDLSVPTSRIMDDIAAARHKRPTQKIAVLLGERHSNAASALLPLAVMNMAIQRGIKPSFAIEYAVNVGHELARVGYHHVAEAPDKALDESSVLSGMLGFEGLQHVTHTKARYLLKAGISPCFSDAARAVHDTLDRSHSLTDRFTQQARVKPARGDMIFAADRQGMIVRNRMMVDLGIAHHMGDQGDVLIHAVGASHIAGFDDKVLYQESMMALYEQAGYQVLSYMLPRGTDNLLPQDTPKDAISFLRGLDTMPRLGARSPAERIEIYRLSKASKGLIDFADIGADDQAAHAARFITHLQQRGFRPATPS